ncbi:MAG: proline iminopeptidase-family hydrolase [Proteobacteria bacterium]|nr:proline iminopeptidase-family hydrolase [Pseudomonadota bacterium]
MLAALAIVACGAPAPDRTAAAPAASWFDTTGHPDVYSGGVRLIPVTTPKGTFNVWTKRVGNNPHIKLLLLHGGPGATHEYFESADSYLPAGGVEYYYYDQLGSFYSDQPKDSSLWRTDRFVEEVEQVRKALGMDSTNFFLLGHSWGGVLATEYALKYGKNLKGLVISNMMSSIPAYNEYATKVLMPAMDQKVLAEIKAIEAKKDYANPRYMALLGPNHYEKHILRRPAAEWPDPVNRAFNHINKDIYIPMQGPSELGASGKLETWDRSADLKSITVPTLVIAGTYDTMDPKHMEWMSTQFPKGRFLLCPNSGHMAMYDDGPTYYGGLIKFMKDVDAGTFGKPGVTR